MCFDPTVVWLPSKKMSKDEFNRGRETMSTNGSQWRYSNFVRWTATASGKPATFAIALFIVIIWADTGPIFGYIDTWQLVINTGTTIVMFLMVFLIQNTQNRDTQALQLSLTN